LDFWIFGFLDFWIFGFLDFWIFGFLDFWIFIYFLKNFEFTKNNQYSSMQTLIPASTEASKRLRVFIFGIPIGSGHLYTCAFFVTVKSEDGTVILIELSFASGIQTVTDPDSKSF
jgi:hypothetical protein